jgi:hypothetical protein
VVRVLRSVENINNDFMDLQHKVTLDGFVKKTS